MCLLLSPAFALTLALTLALALAPNLVASTSAHAASTPLASVATQSCPADSTAVSIKVLYRLYDRNHRGGRLSRDDYPQAVAQAQEYADITGSLSECALRMRLDIVAEDNQYPDPNLGSFSGYDALYHRYPAYGDEDFEGKAIGSDVVIFPVPGEGVDEDQGFGVAPDPAMMLHEWLHLAVERYAPPLGWPREDVHGACNYREQYPSCGGRDLDYFGGMMTGKVMHEGQPRGMRPQDWREQGSSTDPRNLQLGLSLAYRNGAVTVLADKDYRGPVSLSLTRSGQATRSQQLQLAGNNPNRGQWKIQLGFGRYRLCAQTPASLRYKARQVCRNLRLRPITRDLVSVRRQPRMATLTVSPPLRGRNATVTYTHVSCTFSCRTLSRSSRRVSLTARTRLSLPRPKGAANGVVVTVSAPAFTHQGVRWSALRLRLQLAK